MTTREHLENEGWLIRITRWHQGYQVGAYWPTHPHKFGTSSDWKATEAEAWTDLAPKLEAVRAMPDFPLNVKETP